MLFRGFAVHGFFAGSFGHEVDLRLFADEFGDSSGGTLDFGNTLLGVRDLVNVARGDLHVEHVGHDITDGEFVVLDLAADEQNEASQRTSSEELDVEHHPPPNVGLLDRNFVYFVILLGERLQRSLLLRERLNSPYVGDLRLSD